jgi:hypothetical protein
LNLDDDIYKHQTAGIVILQQAGTKNNKIQLRVLAVGTSYARGYVFLDGV